MIGVPSPVCLAELLRARRVEAGGHEDRAAARVEVEHLGRVGREQEAVVDRPLADRVAAALQDGDVERVDLRLEEHLARVARLAARGRVGERLAPGGATSRSSRCSVQSPPRSTFGGHAGQRHDRADLLALPGELERRHVALDAVVVRGERRRARELDRAVLADQAAARDRRRGHAAPSA